MVDSGYRFGSGRGALRKSRGLCGSDVAQTEEGSQSRTQIWKLEDYGHGRRYGAPVPRDHETRKRTWPFARHWIELGSEEDGGQENR